MREKEIRKERTRKQTALHSSRLQSLIKDCRIPYYDELVCSEAHLEAPLTNYFEPETKQEVKEWERKRG